MSFIPGADGYKSVFKDDIQVDHVAENTSGHGARHQAITNPTAWPINTGDVGQVISAVAHGININTSTQSLIATIELTAGVWLVSGTVAIDGSVATTATGLLGNLNLKTNSLGTGFYGIGNLAQKGFTAGGSFCATFAPQVVTASPSDEMTCSVDLLSYGHNNVNAGHGYIVAVRIV